MDVTRGDGESESERCAYPADQAARVQVRYWDVRTSARMGMAAASAAAMLPSDSTLRPDRRLLLAADYKAAQARPPARPLGIRRLHAARARTRVEKGLGLATGKGGQLSRRVWLPPGPHA